MYDAMSDAMSRLSTEEMAELAALADGTLSAEQRPAVEARVAASPALAELLERQRDALRATRLLADAEVPASLRVPLGTRRRKSTARFVPRLALAGVAAVAAAVVAAIVLSGGPGAPTVADAARLGTHAPTGPAPAPAGHAGTKLAIEEAGVVFPDFASTYGWQALGVRTDRVDGRDATVVFYGRAGRRLGYVIVAGVGLTRPSAAERTVIRGVEYQTLSANGRLAVTWRRGGHTCVLIGSASRAELVKLASWPLTPPSR
jgi:anti-sigma factor RsiW